MSVTRNPITNTLRQSALVVCVVIATTQPLLAVDLDFPANTLRTAQREEVATLQPLPSGAFTGADTQFLAAEGRVVHTAYKIASTSLTPFQLIAPLKNQLEAKGYTSLFACADTVCGGFDFRYLLDLLPEPHMHVDLGKFQYLLAEDAQGNIVALVTSRARTAGFLHITQISPEDDATVLQIATELPRAPDIIDTTVMTQDFVSLAQDFSSHGAMPLDDLAFETGSSQLGDGPFDTLRALALYLSQFPDDQIVLVGHTDAQGSLESNIALSRKRAVSVRDRLINAYGVDPRQMTAQGIGYLAPRASNTSVEGRETNRRVEAVLASTP